MTSLPVSALPYIPSAFSPGDRLDFAGEFATRDDNGRWICERPECSHDSLTDADVRRLYTSTETLTRFGLPLLAPGEVSDAEPLPGRAVATGEAPFERDRPYLVCGNLLGYFHPITEMDPGPWGTAQGAATFNGPKRPGEHEMTLTATGVVWVRTPSRFGGHLVTYAFIPAEMPSGDDVVDLMSVAVLRAAFPADGYVPRVPRHAF